MNTGKKIYTLALTLLLFTPLKAQFMDVDWKALERDSVLPEFTTVVETGDDFLEYNYSAHIEYPEFRTMSKKEIEHFRLEQWRDSITEYPTVKTSIGISAKKGMLDIRFTPVVYTDGKFRKIESFKLVIKKRPKRRTTATRAKSASERYAQNSVLSTGKWVKIRVSESGVYKITHSELSKMGFSNPGKVRLFGYGGLILPETDIHEITDDLCEVPLWRENNYILFYANGTIRWNYKDNRFVHKQNVYSQHGYYFLHESDDEPQTFPVKEYDNTPEVTYISFPEHILHEKEEKSLSIYGRILLEGKDFSTGRSASYKFNLPNPASKEGRIDISFGSNAVSASYVTVVANNEAIGSLSIPIHSYSDNGRIASNCFNAKGIEKSTTVQLTHKTGDTGVNGFLDYIRINYSRLLSIDDPSLNFRGNGSDGYATYKISNATSDTRVWRVTDPADITEIKGTLEGSTLSIVAPASHNEEFVAVNVKGNGFPSPTVIGTVANQNLHSLGQTDLVIIVPSNGHFIQAAEQLAEAHRLYDGITVAVVTAEQVYNEFSSGTPDATAYRRLMKMLYDRAETAKEAPKYLLLFGDGLTDNRLITYSGYSMSDYLLCYESENSVSPITSYVLEDYFGFLDDDEGKNFLREKVDLGIGRIPAHNAQEASAVVNKLIAYMKNTAAGAWQNIISMLGDDGDEDIPNQHMEDAEAIASMISENIPSYIIDRIYWDEYPMEVLATGNSYPMVTQAIYNRMDEGALIVNYSGHGSAQLLSHEMAWKASDMKAITSPRIPFWVTASCDITPFDMGNGSLGEEAILNPNGAAIGLFTTTRTVIQSYNAAINQQFMRKLMLTDNPKQTVGDASREAKCAVITSGSDPSENKLQYIIIGDPALRLNTPKYKAIVEKFNGNDTSVTGSVKAGGNITIEGYIAKPDGSMASDFTGIIFPTLFDCAEEIHTRDNTGLGKFTYTTHRKKLFAGSDSVKNGRFKITMPIPMDISYSDDYGMLNLFASDTTGTISAQGYYENFTVGGTSSSIINDGKGPEITMYLNSPDFKDGDEVNATPMLHAELYDENGINTVGTGIGHDIMAIIDNDIKHTYNLNNTFTTEAGNHRRGTIEFPIGELAGGEHTLLLRAWDLYNNSATDTLYFTVVPNLAPDFIEINVTPNPVHYGEKAQFTLHHDRPMSNIQVTIELFNFQGQKLWSVTEDTASDSNTYTYTWDVTAQSGQPMPTGVYIYRAKLSSGSSEEQIKTGKIIILNNK